jgi:hypothetical protein
VPRRWRNCWLATEPNAAPACWRRSSLNCANAGTRAAPMPLHCSPRSPHVATAAAHARAPLPAPVPCDCPHP